MKKNNAGNLFSGMRSSSLIAGLFVGLIVSIVLLFANFTYLNVQSGYDTEYITHAGELRVLSQRIAKNATEAAAGKAEAFALLKDARNDFDRRWGYLTKGNPDTGLPMVSFEVAPQMDAVEKDWNRLRRDTDVILGSTLNELVLLPTPAGLLTLTGPVSAPGGTTTCRDVPATTDVTLVMPPVDSPTGAAVTPPANVTPLTPVSPIPPIVTVAPTGAAAGVSVVTFGTDSTGSMIEATLDVP